MGQSTIYFTILDNEDKNGGEISEELVYLTSTVFSVEK